MCAARANFGLQYFGDTDLTFPSPTLGASPGDFVRRAQEAIDDILSRDLVPVVVGGTMMYVQWLIHGVPDAPKKAGRQVVM